MLAMIYDLLPAIATVFIAATLALPFTAEETRAGVDPLYTLYVVAAWFAYFGICWTRAGQTLGLRAWRVRIVTDSGDRPGWRAAAIRFGAAFLSAAALGFGFWSSLLRDDRACWHDRLSGTRLQRIG